MTKLFETVKKGSLLNCNGEFNKYCGVIIAQVTFVEIHGDCLHLTYKGLCEGNPFMHTITVNRKSSENRVVIHKRKWDNFSWKHLNWLKTNNLMNNQSHLEYSNRKNQPEHLRKNPDANIIML